MKVFLACIVLATTQALATDDEGENFNKLLYTKTNQTYTNTTTYPMPLEMAPRAISLALSQTCQQ